jgi:hypothetical protein
MYANLCSQLEDMTTVKDTHNVQHTYCSVLSPMLSLDTSGCSSVPAAAALVTAAGDVTPASVTVTAAAGNALSDLMGGLLPP